MKNVNNGGVGHKCSTENPVGQTFIVRIVVTCIWDHIRRKNWMKVKIGSYPDRWVSNVHTNHMEKKYGILWENNITRLDKVLEVIEDALQTVYNHTANIFLDSMEQSVDIHIDPWDTWSMDSTLAPIILPMLTQLKKTGHGAPNIDFEDVPENLRPTEKQLDDCKRSGDVDPNHFTRWDWVMDEMIWAFEQKCRTSWESDYYEYRAIGPEESKDETERVFGLKLVWEDREGSKAHQERMSNGFKLFGRYFENLWD